MKKIKFYLSIGFVGAAHEDVIEFVNTATDEEIEAAYQDWVNDHLDGYWHEIKAGERE